MTQRLTPAKLLDDLAAAGMLLTRVPMPVRPGAARRTSAAAWCFPLLGAGLGLVAGAILWIGALAGLPAPVAAAVALTAAILLTGALHEDGLADCADGFWGGRTAERRLEIMKDSRVGAYGVLAIGLSLLLRWSALTALAAHGSGAAVAVLIAAGALSRAAMGAVWCALPPARPTGLARSLGRPTRRAALAGAGLAGTVALACLPPAAALTAAGAAALAAAWAAGTARRRIGGQTGDVLGATQQLAEIAALLCLSSALT